MTFNQWCGGKHFTSEQRLALEAVWNAMVGTAVTGAYAKRMLDDLFETFPEPEDDPSIGY